MGLVTHCAFLCAAENADKLGAHWDSLLVLYIQLETTVMGTNGKMLAANDH